MLSANGKVAGTLLLVGGAQFIVALIIAEAVYPGYSVHSNYISDLGVWGKPSAVVFNPSIMLFGLTVLASSYFIDRHFHNRVVSVLVALAGLGALGVGVFPENTFVVNGIPVIHYLAASLAFVIGGFGSISFYWVTKPPYRYITVTLGAAALVAVVLFLTTRHVGYLGLGVGGMERMMAYPTLLGLIGFGGYLLASPSQK